jgi:hypothetical protein
MSVSQTVFFCVVVYSFRISLSKSQVIWGRQNTDVQVIAGQQLVYLDVHPPSYHIQTGYNRS